MKLSQGKANPALVGAALVAFLSDVIWGLGLAGLEEAARAAGGSLRHGPTTGGGFEVVAELPARADQHREVRL